MSGCSLHDPHTACGTFAHGRPWLAWLGMGGLGVLHIELQPVGTPPAYGPLLTHQDIQQVDLQAHL